MPTEFYFEMQYIDFDWKKYNLKKSADANKVILLPVHLNNVVPNFTEF